MSRFYNVAVTPATVKGQPQEAATTWTNFDGKQAILGAQTIEFDFNVVAAGQPAGESPCWLRIWGPTKQQISQAANFTGAAIQVYGGMQKGLPLATAAASQQGLLVQGTIFPGYGNWQGLVQTLEFLIINTDSSTQAAPANLTFSCKKGQTLSSAIQTTLTAAFPALKLNVNVQTNVVLTSDESNVSQTLVQFAAYIQGLSQNIIGGTYPGISIVQVGDTVNVYDTSTSATVTVAEQDLIGSVTWLDQATIQFTTVLRADIQMGTTVSLPPLAGLQAATTSNGSSIGRASGTFTGTWNVVYVRHIGNSRAPDANAWVSTFQAQTTGAGAVTSGANTSA